MRVNFENVHVCAVNIKISPRDENVGSMNWPKNAQVRSSLFQDRPSTLSPFLLRSRKNSTCADVFANSPAAFGVRRVPRMLALGSNLPVAPSKFPLGALAVLGSSDRQNIFGDIAGMCFIILF